MQRPATFLYTATNPKSSMSFQPAQRSKLAASIVSSTMITTSFLAVPSNILPQLLAHDATNKPPRLRHISQPHMSSSRTTKTATRDINHKLVNTLSSREFSSDLAKLKAITLRLNLTTRRPSYLDWLEHQTRREKPSIHGKIAAEYRSQTSCIKDCSASGSHLLVSGSAVPNIVTSESSIHPKGCVMNHGLKAEWKEEIRTSLNWLREELHVMKEQDQALAKQLLSVYHDIHKVRLSRSCREHQELLDDVQCDLDERSQLSNILDLPPTCLLDNPLQHVGVTRLNLNARRFSTC